MHFTIKVDKIPSVNSLYAFNPKTKSKYLTKEGKLYKEGLKQSLQSKTKDLNLQFINDSLVLINNSNVNEKDFKNKLIAYDLSILFFLNSGILSRDTSNLIKATEDAIFDYLGINDNRVFKISSEKIYNDLNDFTDKEMITVVLTPKSHIEDRKLSVILKNTKDSCKKKEFEEIILEYLKER